MKIRRRTLLHAAPLLLATAALPGCASPPTHYYRLAAIPGAIRTGAPKTITIRGIGIPGYLDQNGIPMPGATAYQVNTFPNDIWAEPPAGMLQDVMVQNLSQRLPASTVLASGGAIGATADTLLEINVLTFNPDSTGNIILTAQIAIRSGSDRRLLSAQALNFSAPATTPTAPAIVATMSTLWAQAADQLTSIIINDWSTQTG